MKKDNSPIISVIMPMYNAEKYIAQAINSILGQSFREIELIIIDDKSTDQSRSIVESFLSKDSRIILLTGSAQGAAAAANKGMKIARGKYISFCDADDLFSDNSIESQVNYIESHPEAGATCAKFAMMDSLGGNIVEMVNENEPSDITEELLSGVTRTHACTFMVRKEIIEMLGGYREFFVSGYDIDFQLRLAEACKVVYLPIVTYLYRLHDTSIVHTQSSSKREFFEKTARLFRRQRAENGKDDLQLGHPPQLPDDTTLPLDAKTQLQGILIGNAWRLHKEGQKLNAIKMGFRACRIRPEDLMSWKSFLMLIIK